MTIALAYADAAALSRGELTPADALNAGRIRVRGDLSALVAAQQLLDGARSPPEAPVAAHHLLRPPACIRGGSGVRVPGMAMPVAAPWGVPGRVPTEGTSMEVLTSRTIIHPDDLDRSLAFYGDGLGLAVAREFGDGDRPRRGLLRRRRPDRGGGGRTRSGRPTPDRRRPGGPVAAGAGRGAAVAELADRGVPVVRPPALEPWGLIEAWIDDPDGIRIHLVEVPADHPLRRDLRAGPPTGGRP